MEKVKQHIKNMPIMPTYILLSITFLLLAMFLIEIEHTLLTNAQRDIAFRYSEIVEGYDSVKVWGNQLEYFLTEHDNHLMLLYEILIWILPPLTYFICFSMAGYIFYKNKIKSPLHIITEASECIADNDLDFSIHYDKSDEMGMLCLAFEKMRSALEQNNREMWRLMDDRKRLNATLSHDIRTPLTVLEGHLNILQKYLPNGKLSTNEIMETYVVMERQLNRLNTFISSMNSLQRLEDIPITQRTELVSDLIEQFKDTATIICEGKQLRFSCTCNNEYIYIDTEIVMQVFENLLSNAVRYAKSSISILIGVENEFFFISVADDGNGFDATTLKSATYPFYTTEKEYGSHLGLGLNICKILCERHNGNMTLTNKKTGGALVTVNFSTSE